jgi:hypothetical protein
VGLEGGERSVIISTKYNFIYLRTKKTASTSIHRALCKVLGPYDVAIKGKKADLTPVLRKHITPPDEPFHTHTSAAKIKPYIRPRFWRGAFKFTSERHPYEKAVSLAYYQASKRDLGAEERPQQPRDFENLVETVVKGGRYASFPDYSIDGFPVVSDFIRHESIEVDLNRIAEKLGLELPPLGEFKTTQRKDRRPAREILTAAQKETVYRFCKPEFELLGYEP